MFDSEPEDFGLDSLASQSEMPDCMCCLMTCISKHCEALPAEVASAEHQEAHYCNHITFYSNGGIDLTQLPVSVSLRFSRGTDRGGGGGGGGGGG